AALIDGRRRGGGRRVVAAFLLRIARRRPHDLVAVVVAATAAGAIATNALWLQPMPHPAPIFPAKPRPVTASEATGSVVPAPAASRPANLSAATIDPMPAPRSKALIVADMQRELARRKFYAGPADGVHGAKTDAAIRDFAQAVGLKGSLDPDEGLLRLVM